MTMNVNNKIIDELLKDYDGKTPEELIGDGGLLKQLTKALVERAMQAEMTEHLGYEKNERSGKASGNARNGHSAKTIKGEFGEACIQVPRDRQGAFEPKLIKKGQTRFEGFDDKILSMYARGMTTRDIQGHLQEMYGVAISPALVSSVTEEVIEEVKAWQARPLDPVYPIVYFDALFVKSRESGQVCTKAVHVALGVTLEGHKELLGLWIAETEGAKFWLQVLTELQNRGLQDIFIACVDGLKGFPEAIATVYPKTQVQLCIVHMVRYSLKHANWKDKKEVARGLRRIYTATTVDEAETELLNFAEIWDDKYPSISRSWQNNWENLTPFFDYPPEIRKAIYTTNAIESLNRSVRKVIKNRGAFPNDKAVMKLTYLALKNAAKKWTMPIRDWPSALNRFEIVFGDRMPTRFNN